MFSLLKNLFTPSSTSNNIPAIANRNDLFYDIPEPTRSLLWVTNEDTSNIEYAGNPGSISVRITMTLDGYININEAQAGIYSEPSLIWTKLPIRRNDDLHGKPMYWPAYTSFDPDMRYQYLSWLHDIEKPTNLSYVFLYFYGLERHLLVGDYDRAVDEILRLIKAHPKPSFLSYSTTSLISASLARKRMDIIEKAPFILSEETNESLVLRIGVGTSMTPEDIVSISSRVGFTNKRYIKLHPIIFNKNLAAAIKDFEDKNGPILSTFNPEDFKFEERSVFANLSIPEKSRIVKVPDIFGSKKFTELIKEMLTKAHSDTKEELSELRKSTK